MRSFKHNVNALYFCVFVVVIVMFGALHLSWKTPSKRQERGDFEKEQHLENVDAEFEAVKNNVDKCLRAAELLEYFRNVGFYDTAVRNAAYLLSFIRSIVPRNFSEKSSLPCWRTHFEVKLYSKEVTGFVNGNVFKTPESFWHLPLLRNLHSVYKGSKSSELLCLPNIFLAGFPKCGSTYVYCLLKGIAYQAHLSGWSGEIEKEPRMWVGTGPSCYHQYPHQLNDLAQYLFNFMPAVDTVQSSQYSLAIDASPNLLFQWPRYTPWESMENYCLLPAVLPQVLPSNKYIVVLREPASMLYSAFWFSCVTLNVTLTRQQQVDAPNIFHREVVKTIKIFKLCTEHHPIDRCIDATFNAAMSNSSGHCLRLRFEIGFYYNYIRRWLAVVPREQFLFLTTGELSRQTHYKEILDFMNFKVISKFGEGNGFNFDNIKCERKESKFKYQTDPALRMRKDTRKLLNDFFAPFNWKLANLLEDNKYQWKS